jgi:hypothetical protein
MKMDCIAPAHTHVCCRNTHGELGSTSSWSGELSWTGITFEPDFQPLEVPFSTRGQSGCEFFSFPEKRKTTSEGRRSVK